MDTIHIVPTEDAIFSLDDIEFGLSSLQMGKLRTLKATKLKFFKSEDL
jgi:hypothetical protein